MSESLSGEPRLSRIEVLRAQAARLLEAARHPSMKDCVRIAARDLNEATAWLAREDAIDMADMTIHLAAARLEKVERALEKYGPDAMLIG